MFNRISSFRQFTLSVAATCILATSAHATILDGKTVGFTYYFPTVDNVYGSPANGHYVVGAGIEIPNGICCGFEGSVDFSDKNVLVDFSEDFGGYTPGSFNGFRITDVFDTIDSFTSVSISSNMAGLGADRMTFDANNIWLNWQGLSYQSDTFVSLEITSSSGEVPEPSTLALAGIGLLAFSRLRRKA
jgi:hypothetical protein